MKGCDIKELQIHKTIFAEEVSFYRNIIKYTTLSNCIFQKNVYFNHSTFENKIDFHECEFEKIACFYGVIFKKTPNFSQALFKDSLNLVNTNLNFDFEDLELKIKDEYKYYSENITNHKKSLEEFANDFRDSFRNFKSTLIKEHNILDALNYHKVELYCKEIELRSKWYGEQRSSQIANNETDIKKNINKFKEVVDFLLLSFYRKLCEHHTDFLRVLNNLIVLIALYTLFVDGLAIDDEEIKLGGVILKYINMLTNIKDFFVDKSCVVSTIVSILFISCVGFLFFKIYQNWGEYFKFIKIVFRQIFSKSLIVDIRNIFYCLLFILLIPTALILFIPKHMNITPIFLNVAIFLSFPLVYLWLLFLNNVYLRYILVICAYFITLAIIGFNKIFVLNPFVGKLVSDKIQVEEPLFVLITFAYTILMALVLFSLQKTARKNSIIPS